MSDASNAAKSLRDRLGGSTEDRLGRALSDLLENPLLSGAISRAFDARERAAQAQEVAMGALNIPSAADIERLTRRLRAVSHRLEGLEDGVHRLDRTLASSGVEARLAAIEDHLGVLSRTLAEEPGRAARASKGSDPAGKGSAPDSAKRGGASSGKRSAKASAKRSAGASAKRSSAGKAKPKRA